MQQPSKSNLVVNQTSKNHSPVKPSSKQVQYQQTGHSGEYAGELSDQEKELEFNRIHQEYIKMKITRKKELMKLKKEEFGTSSSDQQHRSSDEEIPETTPATKPQMKSKGKCSEKQSGSQQSRFGVVLQLKKLVSSTQLAFLDKEFEINKKVIPYARITKLSLCLGEMGNKTIRRLKVGIGIDEDVVVSLPEAQKNKLVDIFMRFMRIKLDSKTLKPTEQTKGKEQLVESGQGSIACDKLYKKSQIIGTWEQRYIVIRGDGVHSHRTPKSKATMFIGSNQIKELQTQFEFYKQQLVVKLIYGNNTKTDFGLPLDHKLQWVLHFANLIRQ